MSLVIPHRKRPGWYRVHQSIAGPLLGLPGVAFDGPQAFSTLVHETHLPLLGLPKSIERISSTHERWAKRDSITEPLGFTLRPTQQQALDFIEPRRGILLGDDMRLGKTLSAICSHDPEQGPLVVVAPLSTRGHWLGWLCRVFPGVDIGILLGREFKPEIASKPIIFAHYDVLQGWQMVREFGTLVFDEAHLLTNRDARRTLAAALLAVRAKRVIAMTGTPIWKLPPDLWSVLNLVIPGVWGNYYEFSNRYGAPEATSHGTKYTGISHGDELNTRLTEVMLRRRWSDVAQDLPTISRSVVVAEVNQAERNKLDILAGKLKSERSNTAGNLAAYRRQVTGIKESVVVGEARKILGRGEPVVIWTWHRDYADTIAAKLPGSFVIHGDVGPYERERRIAEWREASEPRALIATMAVAQVGIDLSHARFAIFAEIDYTPAILGQAEMRTYDPKRPMDVVFVVAAHLVDQRIVRALIAKLGAATPLGVGAACEAIDALREAVMGPDEIGDVDRLLEDMIASMS